MRVTHLHHQRISRWSKYWHFKIWYTGSSVLRLLPALAGVQASSQGYSCKACYVNMLLQLCRIMSIHANPEGIVMMCSGAKCTSSAESPGTVPVGGLLGPAPCHERPAAPCAESACKRTPCTASSHSKHAPSALRQITSSLKVRSCKTSCLNGATMMV